MRIHQTLFTVLLFSFVGFLIIPASTIIGQNPVAAANSNSTTIALIGCHKQKREAPTLTHLAEHVKPDYCVWLGDNVYADTYTDADVIKTQLAVLNEKPGFQDLKRNSAFLVTWDDHDYGFNNAGKNYPLKEKSRAIHREFWELEEEVPEERQGVYYAKIKEQPNGKRIQFIMLDGRYNKTKPSKKGDVLGEEQWQWLEEQLDKPADLRFIVSGFQILLDKPTKWEAWVKLGKSRQRLFDMIKRRELKGVVFLTGDQHYVEVLRKEKAIGYDAYEIMAAGINKTEKAGKTKLRVMDADETLHSAPLLNIHWNGIGEIGPHIEFTNTDVVSGKETSRYLIFFKEIGL